MEKEVNMVNTTDPTGPTINLEPEIKAILSAVDQEREREILIRRFGLYDRYETLEQIGEMLGITRERVRQLEKATLNKLRSSIEKGQILAVNRLEKVIIRELIEVGRVARVKNLANQFFGKSTQSQQSQLAFVATLAPNLTVVNSSDLYYLSVGIADYGDEKKIQAEISEIVTTVKKHGEPLTIEELHDKLNYEHPSYVQALASVSKLLASLNGEWGLAKWPAVNPKNIRDKIFVILSQNGKPMHFSEIAKAIKKSSFKRKNVTMQAIHNELIKDSRFVLIGRGIYALNDWGFSKGTVSDVIAQVLKESKTPLHRDEIVRRVLKDRQVKETTILLNLQSKPQFKRVAKATYTFKEPNPTK